MSMLVGVWESMYAAIPRLQAEEQLAAYTAAAVAQPAQDRSGLAQRESILASWRKQMLGTFERAVETARRVTPRQLRDILRNAFEEQVRE